MHHSTKAIITHQTKCRCPKKKQINLPLSRRKRKSINYCHYCSSNDSNKIYKKSFRCIKEKNEDGLFGGNYIPKSTQEEAVRGNIYYFIFVLYVRVANYNNKISWSTIARILFKRLRLRLITTCRVLLTLETSHSDLKM